jgi:hypothetical protein
MPQARRSRESKVFIGYGFNDYDLGHAMPIPIYVDPHDQEAIEKHNLCPHCLGHLVKEKWWQRKPTKCPNGCSVEPPDLIQEMINIEERSDQDGTSEYEF